MSGYLAEIKERYGTDLWCDSPQLPDLTRLVELGAVGATSNPVIVFRTVQAAADRWRGEIESCKAEGGYPNWNMTRRIVREAAAVLEPVYRASAGQKGLISIEVDPRWWNDAPAMVKQAREGHAVAPNISVKIPVTKTGLVAIEELAAEGINCTATVSFSVPQAIAIAEAFKRGKARAKAAGKISPDRPLHSFAVLMVGRIDDHLRDVVKEQGIAVDPEVITWAGRAVAKKTYKIYQERGYESRLCIAAMRGNYHVTDFVGGDLIVTMPPATELQFGDHVGHQVPTALMANPVPQSKIDELSERFVDFRRAYAEDGMAPEEFDTFGPTAKTLKQFIGGWEGLIKFVETGVI